MSNQTIPRRRVPLALLYGFWAVGAALTAIASARHPYDPTLTGPARHGQGFPGELAFVLAISGVELVVLTRLLRPSSYHRSWRRAARAFALLTPWMGLWGALSIGGGPATGMHAMVLFVFWVGLAVSAIVSGVSAARARRRPTSPA